MRWLKKSCVVIWILSCTLAERSRWKCRRTFTCSKNYRWELLISTSGSICSFYTARLCCLFVICSFAASYLFHSDLLSVSLVCLKLLVVFISATICIDCLGVGVGRVEKISGGSEGVGKERDMRRGEELRREED